MKRPRPGQRVTVHWLDSGAGGSGAPSSTRPIHLWVKHTHGEVLSVGPDEELAKRLPRGSDSTTLVLVMCSAGPKDDGSDLAAIWWPAVLKVEKHR